MSCFPFAVHGGWTESVPEARVSITRRVSSEVAKFCCSSERDTSDEWFRQPLREPQPNTCRGSSPMSLSPKSKHG
eukprot:6415717-Amphidinium_carterae.1